MGMEAGGFPINPLHLCHPRSEGEAVEDGRENPAVGAPEKRENRGFRGGRGWGWRRAVFR